MEHTTAGTVLSVSRQWWLKVNTKALRTSPADGAAFPHIIKVQYTVGGKTYLRRKWISPLSPVPAVGAAVMVRYREENPKKATLLSC